MKTVITVILLVIFIGGAYIFGRNDVNTKLEEQINTKTELIKIKDEQIKGLMGANDSLRKLTTRVSQAKK